MAKRKFLSFKPIAGTILGLAFATITGVNVYLVMEGQKDLSDSDVTLKNIEALSEESNEPKRFHQRQATDGGRESECADGFCVNCQKVIYTCVGVGGLTCSAGVDYEDCYQYQYIYYV
jgi:hypothetical protein